MLVIKDPYGEAPLTALAVFILEEPACVRVTTKGNLKETDFVTELPKKKEHRVPILGMYAEKANDIVIEILDDEGNCVKSHTFTIRTKKRSALHIVSASFSIASTMSCTSAKRPDMLADCLLYTSLYSCFSVDSVFRSIYIVYHLSSET